MMLKNIFENLPEKMTEETIETLSETGDVRIERIVSNGQASPSGFWYDQPWNEYVILLRGRAGLLIDGEQNAMVMEPGDYLDIRAHVKHRVEWTDPDHETVWLAVHYH